MWSNRERRLPSLVVSVVSVFVAIAGCSSGGKDDQVKRTPGEERAAAAVTGLKETRAELVAGRAQIDRMMAAMNAMRDGQGALPAEFATFNEEVKKTDAHAAKTRARATDMRTRAGEYQSKWRQEMGKVEDPALRAAATARANMVRERYDGIAAKANDARAAYDALMKQLRGVQTYLSNDLTPDGVRSAANVFDTANANAKTVNERIDAVVAELDAVTSHLATGGPGATTAPAR